MKTSSAPKSEPLIRPALLSDADAVARCVKAAFTPYIERIGKPPAPMLADFPELIAAGKVWVVSVPDYGMWGGTLSWYNQRTDSFGGSHRDVVKDCSLIDS